MGSAISYVLIPGMFLAERYVGWSESARVQEAGSPPRGGGGSGEGLCRGFSPLMLGVRATSTLEYKGSGFSVRFGVGLSCSGGEERVR